MLSSRSAIWRHFWTFVGYFKKSEPIGVGVFACGCVCVGVFGYLVSLQGKLIVGGEIIQDTLICGFPSASHLQ